MERNPSARGSWDVAMPVFDRLADKITFLFHGKFCSEEERGRNFFSRNMSNDSEENARLSEQ
jgi:hypothetical protein